MATGGAGTSGSLEGTPTWALATVCFVFVFFGIFIEQLIHLLCHWLKKHRKTALYEAVEKLKSVLMLLGFISLILTVTQKPIAKICIPTRAADTMLPCRKHTQTKTSKAVEQVLTTFHHLVVHQEESDDLLSRHERILATAASASSEPCASRGMTSLISQNGINQLNIFIFVIAIMQIVYSVATMALGRLKMRRWEHWEKETQTVDYLVENDPQRFRFAKQTTFGRRHMNIGSTTAILLWIKCFFRQFFHSVAKVDYLTLRHGFIATHLSTNSSFNFQKYIQRSLEDDFKRVVGISPYMWFIVVIFLLVDVHGWNVYLWVSFVPLVIVLVIGTKLEVVVARMALRLQDQNTVVRGTPLVQPNDSLFWFNQPQFVLTLLHLTLFMNAFEFSFFIWVTLQFGIKSCYHESTAVIVIRVVLAVMVQVLCSYITLPLYALVTQMGSKFKSAVLEEQTVHALRQWHADVRKKKKKQPYSLSPGSTPDATLLNRNPTLSEFLASPATANEIVEEEEIDQNQKNMAEDSISPVDDDRIQISDVKH